MKFTKRNAIYFSDIQVWNGYNFISKYRVIKGIAGFYITKFTGVGYRSEVLGVTDTIEQAKALCESNEASEKQNANQNKEYKPGMYKSFDW